MSEGTRGRVRRGKNAIGREKRRVWEEKQGERGRRKGEERETWRERERERQAEWMKHLYHNNRTVHSGMCYCTHSILTSQGCFKFLPCKTSRLPMQLHPELQAPIEADGLWWVTTLLAGGCPADQWNCNDPSHHCRHPVESEHMSIYCGLITRNCMSSLLFLSLFSGTEASSPGHMPGQVQNPPLGLVDMFQRRAEQYVWHWLGCRDCRKNTEVGIQSP